MESCMALRRKQSEGTVLGTVIRSKQKNYVLLKAVLEKRRPRAGLSVGLGLLSLASLVKSPCKKPHTLLASKMSSADFVVSFRGRELADLIQDARSALQCFALLCLEVLCGAR